jgi:hypothetical protein
MWCVREYTIEPIAGDAPWALLREAVKYFNKYWPEVHAKLLGSWFVASNKAILITEHKSVADAEQWNSMSPPYEEGKTLMKRFVDLQNQKGAFTWRFLYYSDISGEEP